MPGHIILLWRINFGTFTTETAFSKYFEYGYGIDGVKELAFLISEGYVHVESAFESLDHLSATILKEFLKVKNVKGLSKLKRADVDDLLVSLYTEEELGKLFSVRGLMLTSKGGETLERHQDIVAKHPQKKF